MVCVLIVEIDHNAVLRYDFLLNNIFSHVFKTS